MKLKWETKKVMVKDLVQLEINPRKISDEKRAKLKRSIDKFNLVEIPAVNYDMKIIGGNQRVAALIAAGRGDDEIDVRYPNRMLTELEVKEYAIISNTHAGEFDFDILDAEFGDIDLDEIGFNIEGLDAWDSAKAKEEKQLGDDDAFDTATPISPITVLGDLYEIGEHRLLCGDSTDSEQVLKLMDGKKANMVFTDPPYDMLFDYTNTLLFSENCHVFIFNNDRALIRQLNESTLEFKKFFVFYHSGTAIPQEGGNEIFLDHVLVSHEVNGNPKVRYNKGNGTRSVIKGEYRRAEEHKHQKPVSFLSPIIEGYSNEGFCILDFFAGGGSMFSISHQLKRKCYGMELDPKYCDVIVKRMLNLDNTLTVKRNGVDVTDEFKLQ